MAVCQDPCSQTIPVRTLCAPCAFATSGRQGLPLCALAFLDLVRGWPCARLVRTLCVPCACHPCARPGFSTRCANLVRDPCGGYKVGHKADKKGQLPYAHMCNRSLSATESNEKCNKRPSDIKYLPTRSIFVNITQARGALKRATGLPKLR